MFWKTREKVDREEQRISKLYTEIARVEGLWSVQKARIDGLEDQIASIRNKVNKLRPETEPSKPTETKGLNNPFNPFG